MMLLVDEPGTRRLFVNDMRGPLYTRQLRRQDGRRRTSTSTPPTWGVRVQSKGSERGFQSFAFHPQFEQRGTPRLRQVLHLTDTSNMTPAPDFVPRRRHHDTHDTVLLEWTAKNAGGGGVRRRRAARADALRQPFPNHNGGQLGLQSARGAGHAGLRPALHRRRRRRQRRRSAATWRRTWAAPSARSCASIRSAPTARTGSTAIPADNPFVGTATRTRSARSTPTACATRSGSRGTRATAACSRRHRPEHRRGDQPRHRRRQPRLEQLGGELPLRRPRGGRSSTSRARDPKVTYPVVEYGQLDPLLQPQLGGDRRRRLPRHARSRSSPTWCCSATTRAARSSTSTPTSCPTAGRTPIRRVLFGTSGAPRTLLPLIQEKNTAQGKTPATRADLRFGPGPDGRVFLLNKADGVIREMFDSSSEAGQQFRTAGLETADRRLETDYPRLTKHLHLAGAPPVVCGEAGAQFRNRRH